MPSEAEPAPSQSPPATAAVPGSEIHVESPRASRRDFVLASAAAAVAVSAGRAIAQDGATEVKTPPAPLPTQEPPPAKKRNIKRSLKYGMVAGGMTVLEKFTLLKEVGYDGVEPDCPSDLDLDEVLAARDATGLLIPGVVDGKHWQLTLGDPDANVRAQGRAALEQALRDCKRLGGSTVLLVPAVVSETVAYDDAWSRSHAEIKRVLPLAKEVGVKIALENVWNHFLLSPLEAARYVDQFESDMIGWYLDVGNLVNYAWPEQWVRVLKHRVLKLDFKEFSRKKRNDEGLWKGFDVEIGDGDCNWPEVMKALDEIGYQGWASAEVPGGDAARLKDVLARMDKVLAL